MTPEQTTALRKVITDACPELLNLEYGCEVEVKIDNLFDEEAYGIGKYINFELREERGDNYLLGDKESGFLLLWIPKKNIIEIIGKPIELQHVLRASAKLLKKKVLGINQEGELLFLDTFYSYKGTEFYYDLTKSFEDQSDETKMFLYNLLVKKV